jgi:rubrerythrin
MHAPIATLEEFYAHALAIEHEAANRYAEFAEHFGDRGEEMLAGLCRNLAALELEHYRQLASGCAHLLLPDIDGGEYRWLDRGSPEAPGRDLVFLIATPRQLLEIALAAEWRAHEFFAWIARTSPQASVREIAAIMAAEETEHVRWVREALDYHLTTDREARRAPRN